VNAPVAAPLYARLDVAMRVSYPHAGTELVLDGFPRSGNSYARVAFDHANEDKVVVASHSHSYRVVEVAVARGIPAIVLIRSPRAAVASAVQYLDGVPVGAALRYWIRYYERIERVLDRVVLADFADVTGDFGAVVRRCNERFGTSFAVYEAKPAAERAVAEGVRLSALARVDAQHLDRVVGLPSDARRSPDEVLRELGEHDRVLLERAESVYRRLSNRPATS
jgi:hypothetical protein